MLCLKIYVALMAAYSFVVVHMLWMLYLIPPIESDGSSFYFATQIFISEPDMVGLIHYACHLILYLNFNPRSLWRRIFANRRQNKVLTPQPIINSPLSIRTVPLMERHKRTKNQLKQLEKVFWRIHKTVVSNSWFYV